MNAQTSIDDADYWGLTRLERASFHTRLAGYYARRARFHADVATRHANAATRFANVGIGFSLVALVMLVGGALGWW